eukprot:GFUD01005421.1.p1 GENE.GFUD01005421.1~~GFUD01005421.1.p1  ORF type:complete len:233 (-),score=59.50 GFUD01005421.1:213-911(-)
MKLHLVEKDNLSASYRRGWRLASLPVRGETMFQAMVSRLVASGIAFGGLAGESTISSDGTITELDKDFDQNEYLLMVDENECSVLEELRDLVPETKIQHIQDILNSSDDIDASQLLSFKVGKEMAPSLNNENMECTCNKLLRPLPPLPPLHPPPPPLSSKHPQSTTTRDTPCPECPVCFEPFTPPTRIFQCANGHLLCEQCQDKPELTVCPSCKNVFIGRATAMEQFLADLY